MDADSGGPTEHLAISIHNSTRRVVTQAAAAQRVHGHEPAAEHARPEGVDDVAPLHHPRDRLKARRDVLVDLLVSGLDPGDAETVVLQPHAPFSVVVPHGEERLRPCERAMTDAALVVENPAAEECWGACDW